MSEAAEQTRQDPLEREATHFSRIGGAASIDRLVEAFYARMDALSEARTIRAMHADDLSPTKAVLKRYLGEWMGGPKLYSAERGHPRLRMRHIRFKIGEGERDAWLLCMRGALDEVVADASLREELFEALAKLADWMRNDPDNPHDRQQR
jgi:hemoglobin